MVEQWLAWVQDYFTRYGYAFVFAALFLENVCFLGILIPGAVVLVLCGWLAQRSGGSPYLLALFGLLGTLCGDLASYGIGRGLGERLLASKHGPRLEAVSERVRREPALMAFCHFVAYLRMFVPMSAGLSRVPLARWLRLDAVGASLWVASLVFPSYFLSVSLATRYARQLGIGVFCALVALAVGRYLFMRRSGTKPKPLDDIREQR